MLNIITILVIVKMWFYFHIVKTRYRIYYYEKGHLRVDGDETKRCNLRFGEIEILIEFGKMKKFTIHIKFSLQKTQFLCFAEM